jgi:hypothetical protein
VAGEGVEPELRQMLQVELLSWADVATSEVEASVRRSGNSSSISTSVSCLYEDAARGMADGASGTHEPLKGAKVTSVSTLEFWSQPDSAGASTFTQLRRDAPVSFQAPSDFGPVRAGRGFWAVTRHADVQYVSRTPHLFCSGQGVGLGEVPRSRCSN